MFIPATIEELDKLGWNELDVILISGDAYIDVPFNGIAVIGKVLINAGYKVAIIPQPEINFSVDIAKFGEPKLFWGVSSGCVDSMVANYTALKKFRKSDDFTPGGLNNKRPDRALIVYTNLIRRYFKNTKPIILGGIEASLRRIAHYDYWSDTIRRSILFDSKADILVYGLGEKTILQLAERIKNGLDYTDVRGICYISKFPKDNFIELPSYEDCLSNADSFIKSFNIFYHSNDPYKSKGLFQKTGDRYLIQNPPQYYLSQEEIDKYYFEVGYEREAHPIYKEKIKALETVKFSIISHLGCYGQCSFCSISVHQGRKILSRSEESILSEARSFTKKKDFKGIITDVGGPTANMYKIDCDKKIKSGGCENKLCLYPEACPSLKINHLPQIELLEKIKKIPGVKKVFIASGLRYDMIISDNKNGERYIENLCKNHISGQLKIAPEHIDEKVLKLMKKPSVDKLIQFVNKFYDINKRIGKNQFLTYYIIAAHPGCSEKEMLKLRDFCSKKLKAFPEQIQIFTPLPATYSALMYYTEKDPFTGETIFIEKSLKKKALQKSLVLQKATNISKQNRRGKKN